NSLRKEVERAVTDKAIRLKEELAAKAMDVNGVRFIGEQIDLPSAEVIKTLAYALKGGIENLFLVLGAEIGGKPLLTVVLADNLIKEKGWNAGVIVRELAKEIQGGG